VAAALLEVGDEYGVGWTQVGWNENKKQKEFWAVLQGNPG
jgi:hypothetical protein